MTKARTRRNAPGFKQLSCWISEATMKRLVAFVAAQKTNAAARKTKQRLVVDAAISAYLESPPPAHQDEASDAGE
jgi:hypothetical protein